MKTTLCLLLAFVLCFTLAACTPAEQGPVIADQVCELKADSDGIANVKLHGRTSPTNKGLGCDASASGIEFTAYVEGPLSVALSATDECYFTLYIDGERQEERVHAEKGENTLELANFAEGGVHTIKLIRQTEAQRALCDLLHIDFKGYFEAPPADKALNITFIGDSITVGYGNLCLKGADKPGSALNQDSTKAFSYLTAEKLDADCSLVCCSGIGLVQGYTDFTMDEFYEAQSYYRTPFTAYTVDKIPDIVVINLGTNDYTKNSANAEVTTKVVELIQTIRTNYGEDVAIIWVHGMMNEGKWSVIEKALKDNFGGEDKGIYTLQAKQDSTGGGSHPSGKTHVEVADALVAFIQEKGLDKK